MCAWGWMGQTKAPDAPPAQPAPHRLKYVVTAVTTVYASADECIYRISMRRADQGPKPSYTYQVSQRPNLPAPAKENAILELDPRLVDVELDA
jgi:hypothetical protein